MRRFSVVGAGRLGTALSYGLVKKGWSLQALADRDPAAARESRRIIGRGSATGDLARAARRAEVLFLCVPDGAVASVARGLARTTVRWPGRFVLHTSGLLPAAVLAPLEAKGAWTASLHPVQSFPDKDPPEPIIKGIFWGLEGGTKAVRLGLTVVRTLGGNALILTGPDKAAYHTACSLAANAFVSLEEAAAGLLETIGLSRKESEAVLLPLLQGTLRNVKNLGLSKALSGPVARGDVETVRSHLETLEGKPLLRKIYADLGLQALESGGAARRAPGKIRALRRLLEGK